MNIVVIGAGAMGQLFGALLARAGNDVRLVESDPKTVDAINDRGIGVTYGEDKFTQQVPALFPTAKGDPAELALVLCKAYDTEAALEGAAGLMNDDTYVLTLQNGIDNSTLVKRHVARERVLVGITTYFSDRFGHNEVVSAAEGIVKFMPLTEELTPDVAAFADVFNKAGILCEAHDTVWHDIWEKVACDAALSETSAVCRVPCGGLGVMSKGMDLCGLIIDETCQVARAYDIELDSSEIKATLRRKFFGPEKDHVSSMTQDVLSCRRTEAGAISGGIVHKAQEKGMPAPYNETMYDLLRSIESTYHLQLS